MSTDVYDGLDKKMAMSIGGEYRPDWVRKDHWQKFADEVGVNFNLFRFVQGLKAYLKNLLKQFHSSVRLYCLIPKCQ